MTTDVATTTKPSSVPAVPAPPAPFGSVTSDAIAQLGEWVKASNQAAMMMRPLLAGAFIPDAYKPRILANDSPEERADKIETALANSVSAVLLGLNLGFDPMTALQQIYIVHGRPGMYAKAKVALLQSRGYQIWVEKLTDDEATVVGVRPGSDRHETVTITMDMAKKAGWTKNEAYLKTPQDMLWARAASRVCDRIGAEVLMGLPTVEDIPEPVKVEAEVGPKVTAADLIRADAEPEPVSRAERADRAQRATAALDALKTPTPTPTPAPAPEPERVSPRLSQSDVNALWARMKPHGFGKDTPELALEWLSQTVGREINQANDLTKGDLKQLLAALDALDKAAAERNQEAEPAS